MGAHGGRVGAVWGPCGGRVGAVWGPCGWCWGCEVYLQLEHYPEDMLETFSTSVTNNCMAGNGLWDIVRTSSKNAKPATVQSDVCGFRLTAVFWTPQSFWECGYWWGFPSMGYPNSWMVYKGKSQQKMDDLGVAPSMEPPWWTQLSLVKLQ